MTQFLLMSLQEFNALFKRLRNTRAGLFFTLPVFLVALRLLVYLLFSCLFRLWVQSEEGAQALEKVCTARQLAHHRTAPVVYASLAAMSTDLLINTWRKIKGFKNKEALKRHHCTCLYVITVNLMKLFLVLAADG